MKGMVKQEREEEKKWDTQAREKTQGAEQVLQWLGRVGIQ